MVFSKSTITQKLSVATVLLSFFQLPAAHAAPAAEKMIPMSHASVSHAHNSVRSAIRKLLAEETITVDMVRGSVVLSGSVSSADAADKAVKIARQFVAHDRNVLNFMQIRTGQQVLLRVKIGEVDRKAFHSSRLLDGKTSGGWLGSFSGGGISKLLAEPNLVALSGETAEFSSGGQMPIIANDNVSYKPYGVKVSFTPLVLSQNRIRLTVAPEVTEMDPSGIKHGKLPVFAAHQAKTTVELAPGESFMIAGLLKDTEYMRTGSSTVDHKASELVITVTPYLVDPVTGSEIRLPTDNFNIGSEIDRMFIRTLTSKNSAVLPAAGTSMEGNSGFIAE